MSAFFVKIFFLSLSVAILWIGAELIRRVVKNKYQITWYYYICLFMVIRLLCPVSLPGLDIEKKIPGIQQMTQTGKQNEVSNTAGMKENKAEKSQALVDFIKKSEDDAKNIKDTTQKISAKKVDSEKTNTAKDEKNENKSQVTRNKISVAKKPSSVQKNKKINAVSVIFAKAEKAKKTMVKILKKYQEILLLGCSMVWLGGMFVYFAVLFASYAGFHRKLRENSRVKAGEVNQILEHLCETMHVRTKIRLVENGEVSSPMLTNAIHPCIVLPETAFSEQEYYYLIQHELVHYIRRDLWVKKILAVVRGIYWFNLPIVKMLSKVQECMEIFCDREVVRINGEECRKEYSYVLLRQAARNSGLTCPSFTTSFYGGKRQMKERFQNILAQKQLKKGFGILIVMVIVATFFCHQGIRYANSANKMSNSVKNASVADYVKKAVSGFEAYQTVKPLQEQKTYLMIGEDNNGDSSGFADALILFTVDPVQKKITAKPISRNFEVQKLKAANKKAQINELREQKASEKDETQNSEISEQKSSGKEKTTKQQEVQNVNCDTEKEENAEISIEKKSEKLSAFYKSEGAEAVKEQVAVLTGEQIDGVFTVKYDAVRKIINKLGGVPINISEEEEKYLNETNYIRNKKNRNLVAGEQILNGDQALGYLRVRYVPAKGNRSNEDGRYYRMINVLQGMKQTKIISPKRWYELTILAEKSIETNIGKNEIYAVVKAIVGENINDWSISEAGKYGNPEMSINAEGQYVTVILDKEK